MVVFVTHNALEALDLANPERPACRMTAEVRAGVAMHAGDREG